jgi:glyoxylase-like metal-dependent hydrolase (beta-lactamase superfamily II)
MICRQLLLQAMDVFCYIIGCEQTHKGAVIDPGEEPERIFKKVTELGLSLDYILNTHFHLDHTGANAELKALSGARVAMHAEDVPLYGQPVDLTLNDADRLPLGNLEIRVIHTPGHTPGGVAFYLQGKLFTGDTLFVRDSGRTDLPYSHRETLGASLRKLMELPKDTRVYPGHHYGPTRTSTLEQEQSHNINAREYGFASNGKEIGNWKLDEV